MPWPLSTIYVNLALDEEQVPKVFKMSDDSDEDLFADSDSGGDTDDLIASSQQKPAAQKKIVKKKKVVVKKRKREIPGECRNMC